MNWKDHLKSDSVPWLIEQDEDNPGPRFFALRDVLDLESEHPDVVNAQRAVMESGPVPKILDAQHPDGYWVEPGPGYYPKYRGTVWQIIFLDQLGADGRDNRVRTGCDYILEHARTAEGAMSMSSKPSGRIHCLQGNLIAALIDLGFVDDDRLQQALDWMARSVTGEGIAPSSDKTAASRYLRSGISGPGFVCSANDHLDCAWGAVKVMLALSKVPESRRTKPIQEAIERGVDFLLGSDPATAEYPMGYSQKPNRSWFKFGYPIAYVTDVLQNMEVLTALGYGNDPRLQAAVELLLDKQDEDGRWKLDYTYNGKTWVDVENKGEASKWVSLRAIRTLKRVY